MVWWRQDDKAWSHPKLIGLSSLAYGVWARVGCWCSDHTTDGIVTRAIVHSIAPEPVRVVNQAIAELVAARLLDVRSEDEFQFHDWSDHQPMRCEVEANRAAMKERQRLSRERRRQGGTLTAQGATVTPISAGAAP